MAGLLDRQSSNSHCTHGLTSRLLGIERELSGWLLRRSFSGLGEEQQGKHQNGTILTHGQLPCRTRNQFMHETSSSICEASGRAMHPGLSATLRATRGGESYSQAQPFLFERLSCAPKSSK
jgi:hypothetical protein